MLVFSDITPPDDGGYRRNWCSILSFYHRNHFTTTPAAVATLPSPLLKILWVLDASETDNKIALYGPKKAYSTLALHCRSRAMLAWGHQLAATSNEQYILFPRRVASEAAIL